MAGVVVALLILVGAAAYLWEKYVNKSYFDDDMAGGAAFLVVLFVSAFVIIFGLDMVTKGFPSLQAWMISRSPLVKLFVVLGSILVMVGIPFWLAASVVRKPRE